MIRLVFLIRSLGRGGAERQLTLLVKALDRSMFAVTVVTLYAGGALRSELEELDGVRVLSINKKGRWDLLLPMWRLFHVVRREQPHVVHGYLDTGNVLALLTGKLAGARVVWGLRASNMDFARYDWLSAWSFRLNCWLSRFPDLIVANSNAGKRHHIDLGYCPRRIVVIPNGFDTERFCPDRAAGESLCRKWGIKPDEIVIGLVARMDPMKDHPTFLRAAAMLAERRNDVRFVCVGSGPSSYQQELQSLAKSLGLDDRLVWTGELSDMHAVYNAFDILTSSSISEGISNSIGEAMACGVPCVVTDVGDSARLVGDTGRIVPCGSANELVAAWLSLLDLPVEFRIALGQAARARIAHDYSLQLLITRTEAAVSNLGRH